MEVRSHPPISHSESGSVLPNSCFVAPWFLWISKRDLTPTNLSGLARECPVHCEHPSPCTVFTGGFGCKCSIRSAALISFLKEDPPQKKSLTRFLKKERRNAENESTNIKTQEAAI